MLNSDYQIYRIDKFSGINLSVTPSQVADNEATDLLNIYLDEKGAINKRPGYKRVFQNSLGEGKIQGLFLFKKKDGTEQRLFIHNGKLYSFTDDTGPTLIYTGFNSINKVKAFLMNDKIYFLDGEHYLSYDGSNVTDVCQNAYVPTITINKPPSGGGDSLEQFNLLTGYFIESFNGDGSSKEYYLSVKGLDNSPVSASIDGGLNFNQIEGTHFTIDRASGKITFNTAPAQGQNNVLIKASKTISGRKEKILKCTDCVLYGGSNDTRVFLYGNPEYPNTIFRSYIYKPEYFPENDFQMIGSNNEKIQKCAIHYDTLVIHKENSKWQLSYEYNNGFPLFPVKPINDGVGLIAPDSLQIIENMHCGLDKNGIHVLVGSNVRDERNVEYISQKINPRLLKENNLQNALSFEFENKYFLVINDNAYIWDYKTGDFVIWDNIKANCFLEYKGDLYFGSNKEGLIYKFNKPFNKKIISGQVTKSDLEIYNDDGLPINAYWQSKYIDFNAPEYVKNIKDLFLNMKPYVLSSVDIYSEINTHDTKLSQNVNLNLFNFIYMDFSKLTFLTNNKPKEIRTKLKEKKANYLQIKLQNNTLNETYSVMSLSIRYKVKKLVRR